MTDGQQMLLAFDVFVWCALVLSAAVERVNAYSHEKQDKARAFLTAVFLGWAWPLGILIGLFGCTCYAIFAVASSVISSFKEANLLPESRRVRIERGAGQISLPETTGGELSTIAGGGELSKTETTT